MAEEIEYRVVWEIDILAENEVEAAQKAQEIMFDPESAATVFKVAPWYDLDKIEPYEEIDIANY